MHVSIPEPLKVEHDELHAELVMGTKESGKLGEAAKALARALHHHFAEEEEYAIPPLGLLRQLAQGNVAGEMRDVLAMTDRLKAELPGMLAEHRKIAAAAETLAAVAKKKGRYKYVRFAEKLKLHARTEEEILYPAAILVGDYVRLKLHPEAADVSGVRM